MPLLLCSGFVTTRSATIRLTCLIASPSWLDLLLFQPTLRCNTSPSANHLGCIQSNFWHSHRCNCSIEKATGTNERGDRRLRSSPFSLYCEFDGAPRPFDH